MQPNIVLSIRTEAGLTQNRLAEMADVTPLYIVRAEQGLYSTLPLSLLTTLSNLDGELTVSQIEHTYVDQRLSMVNFNLEQVRTHPANELYVETALGFALDNFKPGAGKPADHPFRLFRTKFLALHEMPTSAIKFCTMFGIHPAVVTAIENRREALQGITEQRVKSLGLSEVQMEMLVRACDACL